MNHLKITKKTLIAILLTAPLYAVSSSAMSESWSCSSDNNVREIHVVQVNPGDYVPCNVVYKKLTEGAEDQILWNAKNDDSYCEEKAQGLVARLETSGWVCTETIEQ